MTSVTHPRSALAAAILGLGLSMSAAAQPGGTTPPGSPPSPAAASDAKSNSLAAGDRRFIEHAAQGGMAEVELGQLAQQKASSEQVKQFGERMAQDHGKANEELKQLANSKGVQWPQGLDRKHKQDMERLQKLSGAAFDREYMAHMVADHRKDVSAFQSQARSAKDADVKGFAARTLPTLQEHLKMSQAVNDAVKRAKGSPEKSGS